MKTPNLSIIETRKNHHLAHALAAQTSSSLKDSRFDYEPGLYMSGHSETDFTYKFKRKFFQKNLSYPIFVSSMTGGATNGKSINQNLAKLCREFGLGMGLGSLRPFLDNPKKFLEDFHIRSLAGDETPLFGNIGLAQVESMVFKKSPISTKDFFENIRPLELDGIFLHVNILQEWFQDKGDQFNQNPLRTMREFVSHPSCNIPVIIKEVGHGYGPRTMEEFLRLPISGIEFASFGGTNFSLVEKLSNTSNTSNSSNSSNPNSEYDPLIYVGHDYDEMLDFYFQLLTRDHLKEKQLMSKQVIVSGGVKHALDAHYILLRHHSMVLKGLASPDHLCVGMAKNFMEQALDYSALVQYTENFLKSLDQARQLLFLKRGRHE